MQFTTPDGMITIRITIVGFVDDSTCVTGGNADTLYEELIQMMKEDAQLWHDLLWASGGQLELPKCGYHVVDYEFDNSGIARKKF